MLFLRNLYITTPSIVREFPEFVGQRQQEKPIGGV